MLLEIKINGELAPPLSVICHRDNSYRTGKALCSKLKELIPRQMFRVPIQVGYLTLVLAYCNVSATSTAIRCDMPSSTLHCRLSSARLFTIAASLSLQACIGTKVIASEAIAPYRKDVLAKCYGGDISRKKKLLAKQAEGKKRMKQLGKVEVPQAAFMAVLNINKDDK